jgi:hypothetical protein
MLARTRANPRRLRCLGSALASAKLAPEVVGSLTFTLGVSEITRGLLRENPSPLVIFVETAALGGHRIETEGRDAA